MALDTVVVALAGCGEDEAPVAAEASPEPTATATTSTPERRQLEANAYVPWSGRARRDATIELKR